MGSHHLTVLAVSLLFTATGCEEEVMTSQPGAAPAATASASADEDALDKPPPIREFGPDDFVEAEESRDPFRDFAHLFSTKAPDRIVDKQRVVKASDYALDELKLTGILTRGRASVLLTDPKGFGWILHTGDHVGKAEMVSVGGTDGNEVPINWKVDRIGDDRVVFIREDPTRPEIPPTTRVMPLYPAGDPNAKG